MTLNEYQVLAYRTTNHELTNQGLIENGSWVYVAKRVSVSTS